MKSRLTYIIISLVALVTLGTGAAFAERSCFTDLDRVPGITLDDSQKSKLQEKETAHRKKMIQLKADLAVARVDKQTMMKDKAFKKADVEKQIKKIADIKTKMQMAKLDALDDIRKVLTDEQWAAFSDTIGKKGHGKYGGKKHCRVRGGKGGGHHGSGYGYGHQGRNMGNCPYYKEGVTEE